MSDNDLKGESSIDFSDNEDLVVLNKSDAEQSDDEQQTPPTSKTDADEPSDAHKTSKLEEGDTDHGVEPVVNNTIDTVDLPKVDGDQSPTTEPTATETKEENTDTADTNAATETPEEHSESTGPIQTFEYTIPEWFLTHNVRTSQELTSNTAQPPCRIRFTGPTAPEDVTKDGASDPNDDKSSDKIPADNTETTPRKPHIPEYELSHGTLSALRDLTASALVPDKDGNLSTSCIGPLIRGLFYDEIPLLSGLLQLVAKDLNASLITFNWEDLQELGREFDRQDREKAAADKSEPTSDNSEEIAPAEPSKQQLEKENKKSLNDLAGHYFSCRPFKLAECPQWRRVQAAINTVIDSHLVKSRRHPDVASNSAAEDKEEEEDPILIIHIETANKIVNMDTAAEEYRALCRFSDNVITRRSTSGGKGSRVVLVGSIIKDPNVYLCDTELDDIQAKVVEHLGAGRSGSGIDLGDILGHVYIPRAEDGTTLSSSVDKTTAFIKRAMNLRLLKCSLREQIPYLFSDEVKGLFEPSVEDPSKGWFDDQNVNEEWGRTYWTLEDVDKAIAQIKGRAFGKEFVEIEDVKAVLIQMDLVGKPAWEMVTDEGVNVNEKKKEDKTWTERIERIKREANAAELDLIGSVVNPDCIDVTFDDVIMDPATKDHLQTLISLSTTTSSPSSFIPLATSRFLKSQLRLSSTLLYGPPGTGKTHLARAIASSFPGSSFLALDSATLEGKYTGETEKAIKAAFSLARKLSPCVLFMDEVDALFYKRTNEDTSWQRSALAQFLMEMDGINSSVNKEGGDKKLEQQPFVVVATNRPEDLDEAFYRRLPCKVYFGLPGKEAREQILEGLVGGDLDDDVEGEEGVTISQLAEKTDGYSGSDLKNLCAEAALLWAVEMVKTREREAKEKKEEKEEGTDGGEKKEGEEPEKKKVDEIKVKLGAQHFTKALSKIRPSVSPVEVQGLKQFIRRFNPGACR